jgi:serine/threonine protein kinase
VTHSGIGTDELIDLITRHQIIDVEALWQYLAGRGGAAGLPADPADLVAELVRDGLITNYQGEQLLAGDADALLVGKYFLVDRLGGLDSSVYLARRKAGGQHVALKLLTRGQDVRPQVIDRFRREAEALARLDHPGIVSIKDSGEDGGRLFFAMEYIEGESLTELVQRQGPLVPAVAVRIVHAALEALEHIHDAGLVHRDLEPGHLLIDQDNKVRLVDLGLARFLDEPGVNLTMFAGSSQLLGAVEFQSPEQLMNSHDVDIRTDVYALGAILYYLFTGKAPFGQHALLRLAAGVVTHPQPLAQLRPDLPAALVEVVERMMARDPAQRYQTPAEARAALDRWLNEVSPPPLQLPPRRPSTRARVVRPQLEPPPPPEDWGLGGGAAAEAPDAPPAEEVPDRDDSGTPVWLLAALLFGATAAVALAVSSLAKLF